MLESISAQLGRALNWRVVESFVVFQPFFNTGRWTFLGMGRGFMICGFIVKGMGRGFEKKPLGLDLRPLKACYGHDRV